MTTEPITAIVLRHDAQRPEIVTLNADRLGHMQEIVGGYIEAVGLDGMTMYINEDGKGLGLPINDAATELAFEDLAISHFDRIVGNAVIVNTPTWMHTDRSVTKENISRVRQMARKVVS